MSTKRYYRPDPAARKASEGAPLAELPNDSFIQLFDLLDAGGDFVYFKDKDSRFLRISRGLAERLGAQEPAQARGRTDFDYFPRDVAFHFFEDEQEILRSGQPIIDFEERGIWPDGKTMWVRSSKMLLKDAKGDVIGLFGISRDITAHKNAEEAHRNSMALYHSLVQNLPQNIFRKDLDGRFTFGNLQFCNTLGKRLEEVLGRNDYDFFPADLSRKYQEDDRRVVKTGKNMEVVEEHHTPAGKQLFVRVIKTPLHDAGGYVIGVQGMFWDVTDLTLAQQELERSQQRYALAVEGANDGLWDWDLRTGLIYFAPRWKGLLGFEDHEIGTDPDEWITRVNPEDVEKLKGDIAAHVLGKTAHFENEHRVKHRDGGWRWMLARGIGVRVTGGKAVRMAGSLTDVTERKRFEEQLAHQAFYDTLTGLPNRALFMDRLAQAVTRSRRRHTFLFAVLFLDVDRFKDVNDSLGHLKGDQLLTAIARRLETCVRPGDTVARLGGDEFTILLDDMRDSEDAVQVATRILDQFSHPYTLEGQEVFASASIGIAPGETYENPEDLLRDADTAMYRAKDRGRNCYEVFDKAMHSRAVARLQLETDLRRAIERKEFRVYYQPIVALADDRLVGFEALVRWQHPQRGLVPPADFLPLAEETGLILPIDHWVLVEACRQTRVWQDRYPASKDLRINVNLSTKHFSTSTLVEKVRDGLAKSGLDGRHLTLEITESTILEESKQIEALFEQLRSLNLQLYLDDFGTGYSSLGYLHRFPIDSLKIHSSFVGQLGQENDQGQLVKTITTLAENLRMGVVAEGVETPDQLSRLRGLRCERVQGYLFSRPVSAELAEEILRRGPRWIHVNGNGSH